MYQKFMKKILEISEEEEECCESVKLIHINLDIYI
jgi:hypothetical protein